MTQTGLAAYLGRLAHLPETGTQLWLDPAQRVVGRFLRCQLASAYQPLVDITTHETIAREAFVRSYHHADSQLSPWSLFASAANDEDLVALDRLCRTVHTLNHFSGANADEPLFLNVHGRLLAAVLEDHGRAFRRVLDALEIEPSQIVIETPEQVSGDHSLLGFVLANYRLNGFKVSATLNQASDIALLLTRLRPDYVKLDARRIRRVEEASTALRVAAGNGVRVIFQRVETGAQLDLLREAGARFVQGYLFGLPEAAPALLPAIETPAA